MAIQFYETMLGKMVIEQERMVDGQLVPQQYEIEIRRGNCLAVFIYDKGDEWMLYSFYADLEHIKNIKESNNGKLLFDKIVSCRLNLRYKEAQTLAKYFVMDGIEIVGYYE